MFKCLNFLVLALLLAVVVIFGHSFLLDKAGEYLLQRDELKPSDVIVVLSGEEVERVEYGVRLFKDGWARENRIIMTGGPLVWKYTSSALMKVQAESMGISGKYILIVNDSRSTAEEARHTKELLEKKGYTSIMLVTSPYHSKRASKIFKSVMGDSVRVITAPVEESWFRFEDWWKRSRDRDTVFSEYAKLVRLWIFGVD
jgi:uncharacterized SAM-binding protein YcdF (DUF218 family)